MRPPRPVLTFAGVVAVVSIGLGTLTAVRPEVVATEDPPRGRLPVSSATLVCPDPSTLGAGSATDVTFAAPRIAGTASVPGDTAVGGGLDPTAPPRGRLDARGAVARFTVEVPNTQPVLIRTLGSLAPALAATQVTSAVDGDAQGLAATACAEAGTSAWFVGMGPEVGHRPRLYLVNPEQTPAELDVMLYGSGGPVDAPAARNLVVPAHGVVTFDLDALAPDLAELAVQVLVRSGRVASAVRDYRIDGLTPLGLDWVPAAPGTAATRLVVPGIAGGAGQRSLHLLAPGSLDARVEIRLLTARGPIAAVGVEEVELAAGAARTIALEDVTGGEPVAIELTSDQPIVAGTRVVVPLDGGRADLAYAGVTEPLAGTAIATDVRTGPDETSSLLLTADADAAAPIGAVITFVDPETGEVITTDRVSVPAGATLAVPLVTEDPYERLAVTVLPSADGLYGVLQLTEAVEGGSYLTLVPLRSPELDVEVPRVRYDLSTGLRPT